MLASANNVLIVEGRHTGPRSAGVYGREPVVAVKRIDRFSPVETARGRAMESQRRSRTPGLHNQVHVWVGEDIAPVTSPNDPRQA